MLRLYGELPPDEAVALDEHLANCENCSRELASLRALEETLAENAPPDASMGLLADTRMRLSAALDAEPHRGYRRWFPQAMFSNVQALRSAPFAVAMLLIGAGAGSLGGFRYAQQGASKAQSARITDPIAQANTPIESVSSVSPQPDGAGITVSYNRLVPESATGLASDPFIRRVLAMGVQNPTNPAVQDNATRLLAQTCDNGQCNDSSVLSALMTAARYGGDPSLRTQALHGLAPFIAQDTRVRDAVLGSVTSDSSAQVRAEAVRMLSPVETDSSVRQVLHNASTGDSDPEIRGLSRSMSQAATDAGLQIQ